MCCMALFVALERKSKHYTAKRPLLDDFMVSAANLDYFEDRGVLPCLTFNLVSSLRQSAGRQIGRKAALDKEPFVLGFASLGTVCGARESYACSV